MAPTQLYYCVEVPQRIVRIFPKVCGILCGYVISRRKEQQFQSVTPRNDLVVNIMELCRSSKMSNM